MKVRAIFLHCLLTLIIIQKTKHLSITFTCNDISDHTFVVYILKISSTKPMTKPNVNWNWKWSHLSFNLKITRSYCWIASETNIGCATIVFICLVKNCTLNRSFGQICRKKIADQKLQHINLFKELCVLFVVLIWGTIDPSEFSSSASLVLIIMFDNAKTNNL